MRRWNSATSVSNSANILVDLVQKGQVAELRKRLRYCGFIKRRELVNTRDVETGQTLLMLAVVDSNIDIVRLLCGKGANQELSDKRGWTVLHHSAKVGDKDVMEVVLENAGHKSLDRRNGAGQSALHVAVRSGHAEVVTQLLDSGARMEVTDDQGWTSLHLAVVRGRADCVIAILHHSLETMDLVTRGWSPLHLAVVTGREDIASLLVNQGADTNLVNREGRTAMDIARDNNNTKIVSVILEREFQTGSITLPTPPPTPTAELKMNTLDRWRMELDTFTDDDFEDDHDDEDNGKEIEELEGIDVDIKVIDDYHTEKEESEHKVYTEITNANKRIENLETVDPILEQNFLKEKTALLSQFDAIKMKQKQRIRLKIESETKSHNHALER